MTGAGCRETVAGNKHPVASPSSVGPQPQSGAHPALWQVARANWWRWLLAMMWAYYILMEAYAGWMYIRLYPETAQQFGMTPWMEWGFMPPFAILGAWFILTVGER